jgi:hypothetical protein
MEQKIYRVNPDKTLTDLGGNVDRGQGLKVKKRKPGADYWRRVYRIAGALPVLARLKIALRILKGGA